MSPPSDTSQPGQPQCHQDQRTRGWHRRGDISRANRPREELGNLAAVVRGADVEVEDPRARRIRRVLQPGPVGVGLDIQKVSGVDETIVELRRTVTGRRIGVAAVRGEVDPNR